MNADRPNPRNVPLLSPTWIEHDGPELWGPWGETSAEVVKRVSGYMACGIYAEHGACSCSTGVPGNVCPLGADPVDSR